MYKIINTHNFKEFRNDIIKIAAMNALHEIKSIEDLQNDGILEGIIAKEIITIESLEYEKEVFEKICLLAQEGCEKLDILSLMTRDGNNVKCLIRPAIWTVDEISDYARHIYCG